MATQIVGYINQATRQLVLDATNATLPETGQKFTVTLANVLGEVTTNEFEVALIEGGIDQIEAIPGGFRVVSIAAYPTNLNIEAIPGGFRVVEN